MFTGIIEGLGTIAGMGRAAGGVRLTLQSDFELDGVRPGDSIAVNGACLTAVHLDGKHRFQADISPETLQRTCLANARTGERVNLERALRLSDRLDGHLVSGHVDGLGTIDQRRAQDNAIIVTVAMDSALTRQMILKGSVAVDGISLTINRLESDFLEVSVIPHTAKLTTIGFKAIGQPVNIETDMIGKYVQRFLTGSQLSSQDAGSDSAPGGIDRNLLARNGFL